MYKVMAFTHNVTDTQTELMQRLVKILEDKDVLHYNIPQHRVEDKITPGSVVLTFGTFTATAAKQHILDKNLQNVRIVELPHFKLLVPGNENTKHRLNTHKKMMELNIFLKESFVPEALTVTEQDIPDLDHRQIIMLEKITSEANKDTCFQTSKNGKLIEVSNKSQKTKADILITFQELYTIRCIMDVLRVKEVEIVRINKNTTS